MEWVVYFSITCISAFLLTISIYCCLYIRRNQLQEQEQIRQIEEDREAAAAAATKSIVVSYDCRVYNESDSGMGRYQSPSTSMMDGATDPSNNQVQRSRSALSVSNQGVGGQQQVMNYPSGQIMNPSGLLITTGSGGQLVSSRNSLEGPSSATNELVVHSSIHKSHSSSNVNQQQLLYHQQQGQQSISGSRPRSAGSSNQQHAHHELTCSHPSQGRHHSGPGTSSAGGRREVKYVTVSNEPHDFHQDRNFGNMPPIGSAMAEFQNDFISVFPMNHLEPQPDLR